MGERIGDLWLVREGLSQGEVIVIDALQKVRSDMDVVPALAEFESQTQQQ